MRLVDQNRAHRLRSLEVGSYVIDTEVEQNTMPGSSLPRVANRWMFGEVHMAEHESQLVAGHKHLKLITAVTARQTQQLLVPYGAFRLFFKLPQDTVVPS